MSVSHHITLPLKVGGVSPEVINRLAQGVKYCTTGSWFCRMSPSARRECGVMAVCEPKHKGADTLTFSGNILKHMLNLFVNCSLELLLEKYGVHENTVCWEN